MSLVVDDGLLKVLGHRAETGTHLRFGEESLQGSVSVGVVLFEDEQIVAPTADDLFGQTDLSMEGIAGNDLAGQVDTLE